MKLLFMENKILIVPDPEDFLQIMEDIRKDYLKKKGLKAEGVEENE